MQERRVDIDTVLRCMELTSLQKLSEFMPSPAQMHRPKWLPDFNKMIVWLGMQHCAMSASHKVFESRVRIRLKPHMGVFADADLLRDACFPILSSTILVSTREKLQVAAYRVSDSLYVVPTRPSVKTVDNEQQLVWNPGSAIRLVSSGAKRADLDSVNSKMTRITVAVVTSCRGNAHEEMAVVPAIVLTQTVDKDDEIVCLIDDDVYSRPPQKDKKRFAIVQNTKTLKKVRSDPMTLTA